MKKILLPFLGIAMLVFSLITEAAWSGGKNLPGTIWHIDSIKELSTPDGQTKYVLHVDAGDKYTGGQVDAQKSDYLVWFSPDGSMIDHTVYHYNSPNK